MLRIQLRRKLALCMWLTSLVLPGQLLADHHGMHQGNPQLKQAGPLAFGPDGVLFVGDSMGGAVYAIETGDNSGTGNAAVNVDGLNQQIAAKLGTSAEETLINDMAVNPASGSIYFSVSRGRGPDAQAVIFKADAKGELTEFDLTDVHFAKADLNDAPDASQKYRGRSMRASAITDLQFVDGRVIVAGLSNEEFASKLRVLEFPFSDQQQSSSIEVYHGAHGRLETASPVRTFITYENTVLAAYTCTPLVTIPVEDLTGQKITGKTVAELGNRNNPLDMIVYRKGEQDYLLLANSARGVMKMELSKAALDATESINSRIRGTAGLGYETLDQFENVVQLDKLNDQHAVMLVQSSAGQVDLKTVALP